MASVCVLVDRCLIVETPGCDLYCTTVSFEPAIVFIYVFISLSKVLKR